MRTRESNPHPPRETIRFLPEKVEGKWRGYSYDKQRAIGILEYRLVHTVCEYREHPDGFLDETLSHVDLIFVRALGGISGRGEGASRLDSLA